MAYPLNNVARVAEFQTMKEYTIGDLAREFGVTLRTLRFYEDKGLLSPRREGRARIYDSRNRSRLSIILKAKQLGFTLDEIQDLVAEELARPESSVRPPPLPGRARRADQPSRAAIQRNRRRPCKAESDAGQSVERRVSGDSGRGRLVGHSLSISDFALSADFAASADRICPRIWVPPIIVNRTQIRLSASRVATLPLDAR